jgi:hypothetical protein
MNLPAAYPSWGHPELFPRRPVDSVRGMSVSTDEHCRACYFLACSALCAEAQANATLREAYWSRQSNQSEASKLLQLVGAEGAPDPNARAAQILALAQRADGVADVANLLRVAGIVTLPGRLARAAADGGGRIAPHVLRGLRELAWQHSVHIAHLAERAAVSELLNAHGVTAQVATPELVNIVLGEIKHMADNERGGAVTAQVLMRYFDEAEPQAFGPIAQRTFRAEEEFLLLADEASTNGGVLLYPQFAQIKQINGENTIPAAVYKTYRAVSSGLATLEADWKARVEGRQRTSGPIYYEAWFNGLNNLAELYQESPTSEGGLYLTRLLKTSPNNHLESTFLAEDSYNALLFKTWLLKVVYDTESGLLAMKVRGIPDMKFLRESVDALKADGDRFQRFIEGWRSDDPDDDISPEDAAEGLRIVTHLKQVLENYMQQL